MEKCKKRELGWEGRILGSVLLVEAGRRIVLLIGKMREQLGPWMLYRPSTLTFRDSLELANTALILNQTMRCPLGD